MIHEITPEVLSKDLSGFDIITFDDGLYTQYKHIDHFKKFNKPMYFFVSTGIVCPEDVEQSDEPLYCGYAHEKAFEGNFENYMKWSQIEEIDKMTNCFIGGHSHAHTKIRSLKENIDDTNKMLEIFSEHCIDIHSYCYPYNIANTFRRYSVKARRIVHLFDGSRTPVETL